MNRFLARLVLRLVLIFLFVLSNHVCLANIWVKNKDVDLGKIIQGRPINYTFVIRNDGSKPVKIIKVSPG